jgi:hypothetical protein
MSAVFGAVMILGGIALAISAPFICWQAGDAGLALPIILAVYGLVFGGIALCESKSTGPTQ